MNKAHTSGLALLVVVSFFAVTAAWASAAPEWLVSGSAVASLTSVQSLFSIFITDLKASFLGASTVKCEGDSVGTVGPAGEGEVTEIVDAKGHKYTAANSILGATFLECKGIEGCEKEGSVEGLVWPIGLPWLTQLELEGTSLIDDTKANTGQIGYAIECTIFGIKEEDQCTQALFAPSFQSNEGGITAWVIGEENQSFCTLSGEKNGDYVGEFLTAVLTGSIALSGE